MSSDTTSFDADQYARFYPDVALSGLAPHEHYERYGRLLNRNPSPPSGDIALPAELSPAELDRAYALGPLVDGSPRQHDELVSIIMPSYNNAEWIARAMHAALSQVSTNVELIVVDDGSTDGSVGIARRIANDHANVRVIALLQNFGCYYARNIGVTEARGAYVTTVDSDDIIAPDRILRQLNALKAHPGARACLARTRRWSKDMARPLGDVRYAENTLLWKRSVVGEIGFYDTVRFGGDTEFRVRMETAFGKSSVLRIPDEVYFLRTLDSSLTTGVGSLAYANQDGMLQPSLSNDRKAYSDNLSRWLKDSMSSGHLPRMSFPQTERPFALPADRQNASPSLGHRRVGAMASFPLRIDSLEATIASILPQIDELILYLNDYEAVPDFARHPKIRAILGVAAAGDLRDNGKFYDLPKDDYSYIFTFDDDLIYPPDYTARLMHQIDLMGRSCVVGVHGVIFPYENFTQLSQRSVFHFMHQAPGRFVDLLGTGTAAWHSSTLKPTLDDFETTGVCDLWFTALCVRKDVPLYSVPRRHKWVDEFAKYHVSLWKEAAERPQGYFDIYEGVVAPILERGRVRRAAEAHLTWSYPADVLAAAEIELQEAPSAQVSELLPAARRIVLHRPSPEIRAGRGRQPHFHLVLCGRNEGQALDKALQAIAAQRFGPFTCDLTLVDDGSDDGSLDRLAASAILPKAQIISVTARAGTAYGRDLAIRDIRDGDAIVLTLTCDDILVPGALRDLALYMTDHPDLDVVLPPPLSSHHVFAFRRSLYAPAADAFQDDLGRWIDDASANLLTRHVMRDARAEGVSHPDIRIVIPRARSIAIEPEHTRAMLA